MNKAIKLVVLLFTVMCSTLYAQNEFLNKNNSLAPVGGMSMAKPENNTSAYKPNVFDKDKPVSASKSKISDSPISMEREQFANPGDVHQKQFNEKLDRENVGVTEERKTYRRDMDMGTFKTMSKFVIIYCRDYGAIDGDYVKAWQNGEVINPAILLEGAFRPFKIDLVKGMNVISMEAMNVGFEFPNTAEFMVRDDKDQMITINIWELETTYKAVIKIERL